MNITSDIADIADGQDGADGEPIAVVVRDPGWRDLAAAEGFALAGLCRRAAAAALGVGEAPPGAEVAIVLADDAFVRGLNRDYRGKDRPTNVLAFPALDPATQGGGPPLAGDVVLARETLAREAAEAGQPVRERLAHLVVHGVLHLLGFDHGTESEAGAMERREARALAALGIADPYAGSDQFGGPGPDEAHSAR